MASSYPAGLDAFDTIASDKKTSDVVGGRTHRQMHNDLGDAIESVQTELGVNPAGIYDTVAERLAAVDDRVLDGTISDVDINAAADIDPTKIAGTALTRDLVTVDEDNGNAMIAGGVGNTINKVVSRDTSPISAHVEGTNTEAQGWRGHAEGTGSIAEGKISHAEGNNTICTANDSHAEGNMTAAGRRMYPVESTGSEDAGDSLGVLQYVVIPAVEGDVTSYFPNPLTDDVTGRYGAGAQLDVKGNVYESGMTPAVWTGDTPTTVNDLQWAMHSVAVMRAVQEYKPVFVSIAKAVYSGGKTKVYYLGDKPFTNIEFVYSAYAPGVLEGRNGHHAEGYKTSTWGYGAHAEGHTTRAWGRTAHAEGQSSQALNNYTHAEGYQAKASGSISHAEGDRTVASGLRSHAEGNQTVASGDAAHAEGNSTTASGVEAHAEGHVTIASGDYSRAVGAATEATGLRSAAMGYQSKATRTDQESYSVGKRVAVGDSQVSRIGSGKSCVNAGWHEIYIMVDMVDGRTYAFESMVIGRQTAGTAGAVGNSFAYKFQGAFTVAGGAMTVLGTISRTLVGRTSGMTGDGLSTGPRMSAMTSLYYDDLTLRFDGEADTTFYINVYSVVQELA